MEPFSSDTDPAAHAVYIGLLRRKTPTERLQMMRRLIDDLDRVALARLSRDYPHDTPRQRRLRLQALKFGDELMKRVFGWHPQREGR